MSEIITDVEAYRLLLRQLGEAQDEIERLRAALWFYARPLNYGANPTPMVLHDNGEIARRALELSDVRPVDDDPHRPG